ncbi:MAG: carboxylesterase family protein [Bacteroidales bacterium]|nr:carboxylesterase family protein [Bacteroidales bacterium]
MHKLTLLLLFATNILQAQYAVYTEQNLEYGTAVNYLGISETLTLDLYKPVNDGNTARPLLVLVHGGSWLSGCSAGMNWLATRMCARGYVVASVNYRKGWHKDDYVANPFDTGVLYAADTAEIIRAMYRGSQDVRGAIRWLKARNGIDSTCKNTVLVGGESAGAYISLMVGLLDRPEEKPASCGDLPSAVPPQMGLCQCYDLNCVEQNYGTISTYNIQRPDLGPIEGTLNLNGEDARVVGVVDLFGGLPAEAIPNGWLEGTDMPALYLYHQTCDGVVPFGYGIPTATISANCNLGFTPWHTNLPHTVGSGTLANYFASMPNPPVYTTDFLPCDPFNPAIALFECIRFSQNGAYHYAHNPDQRAEKIATFFAPVIAGIDCQSVSSSSPEIHVSFEMWPNPFEESLNLSSDQPASELRLYNAMGRLVLRLDAEARSGEHRWTGLPKLPSGVYTVVFLSEKGLVCRQLIRAGH